MKKFFVYTIFCFCILQIISFVFIKHPETIQTNSEKSIKAPEKIMSIFKNSCYDCHSNTTKYPFYSKIVPFSFGIYRHVTIGRERLNFSTWQDYTEEEKDLKLNDIYKAVYSSMPLASYIWLHPQTDLSKDERDIIREWTGKAPF